MIELTDRATVWEFFHERLGLHRTDDFRGVCYVPEEYLGRAMSMEHVAVAVAYNAFIGRTCCMHAVIQRPELVSRRIVRDVFTFPFTVCGCEAVLALVDSTNDGAMSLDTRLGFREVHRVPHGGQDGDLVVLQMLRGECRWLRTH